VCLWNRPDERRRAKPKGKIQNPQRRTLDPKPLKSKPCIIHSNPVSVNETRREAALVEYAELKMKILKDTAIIGVGISGALATVDQGVAVSFAMGSVASLAYLQLLTKQVQAACRRGKRKHWKVLKVWGLGVFFRGGRF